VVLAVVVELFGVPVALPFWVSLYRPKKNCPEAEFRTKLELTIEALRKVQTWFSLEISLMADGAYNNQAILKPLLAMKISLTSRLRFDAVLRASLPKRKTKKRGRRPKYGRRLPSLPAIAESGRGWKRIRVKIYGKLVTLNHKSFVAWWPKAGVQLQVVIVRDPKRRRKPTYLSSTDLSLKPVLLIQRFSWRWPIEQLFADVKTWLGLDSAEIRSPKSVLRHAILAFALVTWVRVWARKHLADHQNPPVSFLGQWSELRTGLVTETIFSSIPHERLSKRNCRDLASLMVN
jgi:SRSO17 transposase